MKKLIKIIVALIGGVIAIDGVALFFVSNVNFGNFLTIALGLIIVFVAMFFKILKKWIKALLIAFICIMVVCSSVLIISGKNDTVTYKENAVIVLGAAVHGTTPSLTLKKRLDKAVEYHSKNPDALIVVSGGKGTQEDISEAEAMKNYLVEHGVTTDKIVKEEKSTSTAENFAFSKNILNDHFGNSYTVAFITNEYHISRASLCADRAGIENTTHLHSNTNSSYLISGVLRECFAFGYHLVLG